MAHIQQLRVTNNYKINLFLIYLKVHTKEFWMSGGHLYASKKTPILLIRLKQSILRWWWR